MADPDVIILGAGMAGVAAAYHLCVRQGIRNVLLIDEREPMTLTSNKGTQAYRNWWPDGAMVRLMNRSIDLLDEAARESDNVFGMNRRGYVYFTADPKRIPQMRQSAAHISGLGGGPVREHPGSAPYESSPAVGFEAAPPGADLIVDPGLLHQTFPYVDGNMVAGLHTRRCGWFDAPRLGAWLLERAKVHGATIMRDKVVGVERDKDRFQAVRLASGERLSGGSLVLAAGPLLKSVAALLGLDMPVINEAHGKIVFRDDLNILPNDAPFLICDDPIRLAWSEAEQRELAPSAQTRWLLDEFPTGVHLRTRGDAQKQELIVVWAYETKPVEAVFPPQFSPWFGEVLLRGIARLIPGLAVYFGQSGKVAVDGGYYTKTRENLPLIGALPVQNAYVVGALSGYGVMAAHAAGELIAMYIGGGELPTYASAFALDRYADLNYVALLDQRDASVGQL